MFLARIKVNNDRIVEILKEILQVEDVDIKNYAIESLIEMLEDLNESETERSE